MISIVDDDAAVRAATGALVRSLGYTALTFESAEAFLDSNQLGRTCCLVADLHLGGMTGLELQNALNASGYRIPTIFITGFPDEAVRTQAFAAGAIGFLVKPFDDEDLVSCLEEALNSG